MDQHALLLQTLIDSVKNLTNEVSSLKNKVEALEEENKNLKQQLNLTTFVPLEDCRDEYPEDPKFQQLFSDFDQVPYEPAIKVLFDEFKKEKEVQTFEEEEQEVETFEEEEQEVEENFIEWLKKPNNEEVLKIMNRLYSNPYDWEINFENLSDATKGKLFFPLKEFFLNQIADLPAQRCFNIEFGVNGTWHTVFLDL